MGLRPLGVTLPFHLTEVNMFGVKNKNNNNEFSDFAAD